MTSQNSVFTTGALIFSESFENSGLTGNSWGLFDETDSWNVNGWDVESVADLEIQNGNIGGTTGGSDGTAHAEFDSHGSSSLPKITKTLNTPNDTYHLTFDYMPRPGNEDTSDLRVHVGSESFDITSDSNGNITIVGTTSYQIEQTTNANGWTTFSVIIEGSAATTEIGFEGLQPEDTLGAYLDAINVHELQEVSVNDAVISVNTGDEAIWHLSGAGEPGLVFSIDGTPDPVTGWITTAGGHQVRLIDPATGEYEFVAGNPDGENDFSYTVTDELGNVRSAEISVELNGGALGALLPLGGETQVNTYTASAQVYPSVAALSDGGHVVAWQSNGQDGSMYGIYGQRFDAAGQAVDGEFLIPTYTSSDQIDVSLTGLPDGGFVASWTSSRDNSGTGYDVYTRQFDASGNPIGAEVRVNTYLTGHQNHSSITTLSDGSYVVAWQSDGQDGSMLGVYGQRFDSAGQTIGNEFLIPTYTSSEQMEVALTATADGGFVATWTSSRDHSGTSYDIYARQYDSSGNPLDDEFLVNTEYDTSYQQLSDVAALKDGGFVVTWQSFNQDGGGNAIIAQRYDSSGQELGVAFQVHDSDLDNQRFPAITSLTDGGFLIAWEDNNRDESGFAVYVQRFDVNGNQVGPETQINTYETSNQADIALDTLANGDVIVTWDSSGQDGSEGGIYSQRLTFESSTPTLSDGNDIYFGTSRVDLVDGLAGDDLIKGEGGDDTLSGGAGDDDLYGGAGNDVIDGGDGMDRLFFDDARSAYTIDATAGTVTHIATGEVNTYTNIEELVFTPEADGGVISVNAWDDATWFLSGAGDYDADGDGGKEVTFAIDGTPDVDGWITTTDGHQVRLIDTVTGEYEFKASQTAGTDSFTYTVTDELGNVSQSAMNIEIPDSVPTTYEAGHYNENQSFDNPSTSWVNHLADAALPKTGKWYFEYQVDRNEGSGGQHALGIMTSTPPISYMGNANTGESYGILDGDPNVWKISGSSYEEISDSGIWATQRVGVYIDMDNGTIGFNINGTDYENVYTGIDTTLDWFPAASSYNEDGTFLFKSDDWTLTPLSGYSTLEFVADFDGTTGNDVVIGDAYDETIDGLAGDDLIKGQGGDDTLSGGDGNDDLYGGAGSDVIDGGDGDKDRLFFDEARSAYIVDEQAGTVTHIATNEVDTYTNIEQFVFAPEAEGGVISVNAGDEATWFLSGAGDIDADGDGDKEVTFAIDGTPDAEGWITTADGHQVRLLNSGTGEYEFKAGQTEGADSFTYTVTDEMGNVSSADMSIEIRSDNPQTYEAGHYNENQTFDNTATAWVNHLADVALPKTGKWYFEYQVDRNEGSGGQHALGIMTSTPPISYLGNANTGESYGILDGDPNVWKISGSSYEEISDSGIWAAQRVGVYIDMDNGTIGFNINGTNYENVYTGIDTTLDWFPAASSYNEDGTFLFKSDDWTLTPLSGYSTLEFVADFDGTTGNDVVIGNEYGETINGLEGDDLLKGEGGDDTLSGGTGSDILTGGDGADSFVFGSLAETANGDFDTITDFQSTDTLSFKADTFEGLSGLAGNLSDLIAQGEAVDFLTDLSATKDAKATFIVVQDSQNPNNAEVYYDADGSGTSYESTKIADVEGSTTITASDIEIITG
ncbi:SPRY domain-containing protein [Terasakiella sp. A23]|uniref:SPRY domain-containing protein n=1 Tax=Terasakiella sp. FCG-A23 TaxID=3080561 RepID=UPI0029535B0A|nr:SPRY domain-containing protein [Terasakiella sp. A23]MDV7338147.1 SPRY domain-containing protein [Terasakiella sp. A23]